MPGLGERWRSPGGRFRSRLILGSGGFASLELLAGAVAASGTALVTVALRRIDPAARGSLIDVLDGLGVGVAAEHRRLLHRTRRGRAPRSSRARRCRPTGSSSR